MSVRKKLGKPPSQRMGKTVETDRSLIALHEAGHSVAAVVLGFDLKGVDIKVRRLENAISSGFTNCPHGVPQNEDEALRMITQTMAGPAAEAPRNPQGIAIAGHLDHRSAIRIATAAFCPFLEMPDGTRTISAEVQNQHRGEIEAMVNLGIDLAINFVKNHADAIEAVTQALLEKRELSGDEVRAIVESNRPKVALSARN